MYDRATQSLHHDEGIKSDADAMMWIREGPFPSDGLEAQDDNGRGEKDSEYLEPNVEAQCGPRVSVVESSHENGSRDDEKEGGNG